MSSTPTAATATTPRRSARLAEKAATLAKKKASMNNEENIVVTVEQSEIEKEEHNHLTNPTKSIQDEYIVTNREVINTIHELLLSCMKANSAEEKTRLANELFVRIHFYPSLLAYFPRLRNAIRNKLIEIRHTLQQRAISNISVNYNNKIHDLIHTMINTIEHKGFRVRILEKLHEIDTILYEYNTWAQSTEFLRNIDRLEKLLEAVTFFPDYIDTE